MAFLLRRHNRYSARVRVPVEHRDRHDGKEFLQRSLGTSDLKTAKAEAAQWEAALRKEWITSSNGDEPTACIRKERQAEGIAKTKAANPERYRGRRPTVDQEAIKALAAQGVGPTAIAKQLGYGRMTIYRVLRGQE